MTGVRVPHEQLSAQALQGVIDDFITREGTDYGHEEHSLENKRAQVLAQLQRGDAVVLFDPELETVTLALKDERRPRS